MAINEILKILNVVKKEKRDAGFSMRDYISSKEYRNHGSWNVIYNSEP